MDSSEQINKGIAEFYDVNCGPWEALLGDHIHHGFYDVPVDVSSLTAADHRLASLRTIQESLSFASISATDDTDKKPRRIVDVGCGIGGSSRYLARRFDAQIHGITLSPVQAKRAEQLALAEGLSHKISFQVADALQQPFPEGNFDLVWSIESAEYMPDKEKFVRELARVAAPGGTIIIVTWCHRDLSPSEENLKPDEIKLMNRICKAYYMPSLCSAADYIRIATSLPLEDMKMADWSENAAPFWTASIRSTLTWRGMTSMLRGGWKTVRGAFAMPLMVEAYEKKLVKYVIFTFRKPY